MAEYLSPGVYIEERPGPKTIEGVSTSTAGFVGMTERGPIDCKPILVTSLGEFERQFGGYLEIQPESDVGHHGYLPLAIKDFFGNGGQRAFVVRAYKHHSRQPEDDLRRLSLPTGVVARLKANAPRGTPVIYLTTLRGLEDAATLPGAASASTASFSTSSLTKATEVSYRADTFWIALRPVQGESATLFAVEPGLWGEKISVKVDPVDGPRIPIESSAPPTGDTQQITVASAASFYPGCTVQIAAATDRGSPELVYATVRKIAGNVLTVDAPLQPIPDLPAGGSRVASLAEVEILVSWGGESERFRGSWRYIGAAPADLPAGMTPAERDAFNAAHSVWLKLHRDSRLVRLDTSKSAEPTGVATYAPRDPMASHPTTRDGQKAYLVPSAESHVDPGTHDDPPDFKAYVGDQGAAAGKRSGIAALADEESIAIVSVPGIVAPGIQTELLNHAAGQRYRFAVLDGPSDADIAAIREYRGKFDSNYGALYYPWIQEAHPETGQKVEVPPSGAVIGIYARTDTDRGYFKAPANEDIRGALDVTALVLTGEQDILNPEGINVIRDFRTKERGIRVWGARTMVTSDSEWRYVNVRRMFIYLEHSIDLHMQWVVFEPNNEDLWAQVRRTVSVFLEGEWRKGAFFGATPAEAFSVKCDKSTMSSADIENGRLICEIGVCPTKPAEFVIFRFSQTTAGAPER